jgi:AraC-like DNA-binding protein
MTYEITIVFEKAVAALEENPWRHLRAVSEALGVERHTVERAFQSRAGTTFRTFRREMMLAKVKDLLASHPTAPIKEVAFNLGYSSSRAFARFVRNAFGCCPCELRRQLMGSGQPACKVPAQNQQLSSWQMRRPGRFVLPIR